jgi:hypothetical protein
MPDEDQRPSLEPPRLFGRKKKARSNVEPERDEEPTAAITVPEPEPTPVPQPGPVPEPEPIPEPEPAPEPEPSGPLLTGYPASAVTGLIVGALMVGLTVAVLRGCEAIRGTSTCGGPGLLLLVIILVILVIVGQALLRAFQVPDPGSSSFLAVGLMAVVALLFLIDVILDWQMLIVIPLVGVATFLLSHWVTTAFVEQADR